MASKPIPNLNDTVESLENFIDSQYMVVNSTPRQTSEDTEDTIPEVPEVHDVNSEGNTQPRSSHPSQQASTSSLKSSLKSRLRQSLTQAENTSGSGKKRKYSKSPIKDSHTLTTDQVDIAEGVFESLVSIMSDYLANFKSELSQQVEISLERHRDEFDSAMNVQTAEIQILTDDLKASKQQCVILEGRLTRAEKLVDDMREQLLQHEARSMRNNLVFHNVPEASSGPAAENTEATLRTFIKQEMKVSSSDMEEIKFDRVHRVGQRQQGKTRIIVANFNPSREKNIVLRHAKNLSKDKNYGVNEQLPRELEERKKQLIPKYKDARNKQMKPKWSLDKLIIGNAVTQVEQDRVRDINTNTTEMASSLKVKRAPPITHMKTSYQGHVTAIKSQDDIVPALHAIYADSRVARASHNSYAYRLKMGDQVIEHYEDDGDHGAGCHLLTLLRDEDITDKLVCVSTWSGGTYLGRARYGHVLDAAKLVLNHD